MNRLSRHIIGNGGKIINATGCGIWTSAPSVMKLKEVFDQYGDRTKE
jgi:hypothetical protein